MTIKDCENCGGAHYGSFRCPFTLAACVVCGAPTVYACSDCAIEGNGAIHVCNHVPCRDAHERQNPQHPVGGKNLDYRQSNSLSASKPDTTR